MYELGGLGAQGRGTKHSTTGSIARMDTDALDKRDLNVVNIPATIVVVVVVVVQTDEPMRPFAPENILVFSLVLEIQEAPHSVLSKDFAWINMRVMSVTFETSQSSIGPYS